MPQKVTIKPGVLRWARESKGLSEEKAAELLRVPTEELKRWEMEGREFSIGELRNLAQKYKRPIAVLVRSTAPAMPRPPEDFRTIDGRAPQLSPSAWLAVRDARRVQSIATDLLAEAPDLFGSTSISAADYQRDSAKELAAMERAHTGISMQDQLRWANQNQAFNVWRAKIQAMGSLVLVKPIETDDCRGFSLYEPNKMPVIVVNQNEVDQAKTFTLLHEYAHLMLRRGGICLENEAADKGEVEAWCNSFAANLLVPEDELRRACPVLVTNAVVVANLATRFKVSRPVLVLRLLSLGLTTQATVDAVFAQSEGSVWKIKPPVTEVKEQEEEEEGGFGRPQEEVRLSEVGYAFPKIVLGALRRGLIDVYDACEALNLRAGKLQVLEERADAVANRNR